MKYSNLDLGTIEAVINKLGGIEGAQAFLRDETKVVVKEEIPLNTIIRVNRLTRPTYPDWMDKVMNPELENSGPDEYDLATQVELWLHDKQKNGATTGQVIFDHLKKNDMLKSCLSLRDAEEIQKKGVAVFQKVFGNKVVYFWKSVVRHLGGHLRVPFLCVRDGRVVLGWYWLGFDWRDDRPAVRFAK